MSSQILNADYWSSSIQPYVADLGVTLVFGLGYYLFKQLHKKEADPEKVSKEGKKIRTKLETHLNKWSQAKTIQKFNALIISNTDRATDAFNILSSMQKAEVNPDIITYNCLLDMSFKLDQTEQAKRLFEEISDFTSPVQPDIVTFNILLKGCVAELKEEQSTSINSAGVNLNQVRLSKNEPLIAKVKTILSDIKTRNISLNEISYNTAMDAFIEAGDFNLAWDLYSDMSSSEVRPDLYTYATLIKGLKSNQSELSEQNLQRVVDILKKIKNGEIDGIKADEVLYNSVLDTCIKFNKVDQAEEIFEEMKAAGVPPSIITYSIIIKGYGQIYKLDKAIKAFNEVKSVGIKPNDIVYGCLLNCAVRCSRIDILTNIYESMKADEIRPNHIIYTTLIKGYNKMKKFDKAFEIFESIPEREKKTASIVVYNAILDCCVESKNFDKLNYIYAYIKRMSEQSESFPQPNVITYSTVIKGFAKSGKVEEAKSIYTFLKSNAFHLDEVLFNTVCDGFARANENESAHQVLNDMKSAGVARTSVIYSILMKMYSNQMNDQKCIEIYEQMLKDNVTPSLVSYTTLMQMFIRKKKLLNAISVFEDMKKAKVQPDNVVYNFIINGCTFNQKLEKGIEYLIESIRADYKLSEETYANCFEYLLNNKFMKHEQRCIYATEILRELKEKNYPVKYEIYSRLMRLIYKNVEGKEKVEGSIVNKFKNFSNMNFNSFGGNDVNVHKSRENQKQKKFYNQ